MKILRFLVSLIMLMGAIPLGAYAAPVASNPYGLSVTQVNKNYKDVNVTFQDLSGLKKVSDKVKVDLTMTYDGNVTQKATVTKSPASIISIKAPTFGTFYTKVTFYKSGKTVKTVTKTVNIIADEYNIAPIVATFPVVYFSLNLNKITEKADGTPVPTIVSLQRPDAYNWDKLPENVYWQPNLTKLQVQTQTNFDTKTNKMADYVKTLVQANPDAKFNLYINDAYSKYILRLLIANGVPESNFHVFLLSDGSGSYAKFKEAFNNDNPQATYDAQKTGWENAVADSAANKKQDLSRATGYSSSRYATMLANEYENIEWWVARKTDTFVSPNTAFVDKYIKTSARVIAQNMNTMLTALSEEQKVEFKALYNFNNQMFAKADQEHKKVMMILGSRANATSEPDFRSYAKFLMKHYGNDYVYYYKGHPATPTGVNPDKAKELADLGIIDVESSIPAELILYFYPDIYMAGYSSSTYASVQKDEMAAGIFNRTKTEALADTSLASLASRDAFKFYIKRQADVSAYPGTVAENDNFYVEFSAGYLASKENKFDFAIYDATKDLLMYYKKIAENEYQIVGVSVTFAEPTGFANKLDVNKGTLEATWANQPAAEKYEVRYRLKYNATWKTVIVDNPSFTLSNLVKGQTVEYRVKPFMTLAGKDFKGSESAVQPVLVLDKNCSTTLSYAKRTLKVSWAATKPAYGTMSYKVYYRVNGGRWAVKTTKYTNTTITSVKSSGRYEVKVAPVKLVGELNYKGASGKPAFRYVRAGIISKISTGRTTATVTVGKLAHTTGYEFIYSTDKSFKTAKKVKTLGASNVATKLEGLGSGRTYSVKMRPYKSVDGVIYSGSWTPVKTFSTK